MLGYFPLVLASFLVALCIRVRPPAARGDNDRPGWDEIAALSVAVMVVLSSSAGFVLSLFHRFALAGWVFVLLVVSAAAALYLRRLRAKCQAAIFPSPVFIPPWTLACQAAVFCLAVWYMAAFWIPYPGSITCALFNQVGKYLAQNGCFPSPAAGELTNPYVATIYFPPASSFIAGYLRLWGDNTASNFACRFIPAFPMLGMCAALLYAARTAARDAAGGMDAAWRALFAWLVLMSSYLMFVNYFELTADTFALFLIAFFSSLAVSWFRDGRPRHLEFAVCVAGLFWTRAHYGFVFLAAWLCMLAFRAELLRAQKARLMLAALVLASGFSWMAWCHGKFGSPIYPYELPGPVLAAAEKIGINLRTMPELAIGVVPPPGWVLSAPGRPARYSMEFARAFSALRARPQRYMSAALLALFWVAGVVIALRRISSRAAPGDAWFLRANLFLLMLEAVFAAVFLFGPIPLYVKMLPPILVIAAVHCLVNFSSAAPGAAPACAAAASIFAVSLFWDGIGTVSKQERWAPLRYLAGSAAADMVKSGDDLAGFVNAARAMGAARDGILQQHSEPGCAFNHLLDGAYYWEEKHFWSSPMSQAHFLEGKKVSDFFRAQRLRYFLVSYDLDVELEGSPYPESLLRAVVRGDSRFPLVLSSPRGSYRLYRLY